MLAFLKDEHSEHSPLRQHNNNTDSEPLERLKDDTASQGYLTVAENKKKLTKNTLILFVLFGIGVLTLWVMIRKTTPQAASAATQDSYQAQLDKALAQFGRAKEEISGGMEKIINKFSNLDNVCQVEVTELAKNPFRLDRFRGGRLDKTGNNRKMTVQELKQQAEKLRLLSIMNITPSAGSDFAWCCMINDKILYPGDVIEGFLVFEITENMVKLRKDDFEMTLKLAQ